MNLGALTVQWRYNLYLYVQNKYHDLIMVFEEISYVKWLIATHSLKSYYIWKYGFLKLVQYLI